MKQDLPEEGPFQTSIVNMRSDVDDFTAVIVTAFFANSMSLFEFVALRTLHQADLCKLGIAGSPGISFGL